MNLREIVPRIVEISQGYLNQESVLRFISRVPSVQVDPSALYISFESIENVVTLELAFCTKTALFDLTQRGPELKETIIPRDQVSKAQCMLQDEVVYVEFSTRSYSLTYTAKKEQERRNLIQYYEFVRRDMM